MKVVSLFANIGVAEAYLKEIGFEVLLANEVNKKRADLYLRIYPDTKMIKGDFSDGAVLDLLVKEAIRLGIELVIATPPCQGMSTAGQQKTYDERNNLIVPTLDFIKKVMPKYALIENVPMFLKTKIKVNDKSILIPDLIEKELSDLFYIESELVDAQHYSVPQVRERSILLLTNKELLENKTISRKWVIPPKHKTLVTMKDVIGDMPPIDPYIKDVTEEEVLEIFPSFFIKKKKALSISRWNNPPHHVKRQVIAMMHTPAGKSAFENEKYKPFKKNGELIKGFLNTYKRQNWDRPAYTITMDNVKISSQNNVHPGRAIGENESGEALYSDPRALTLYELMLLMSLPKGWPIPDDTSEAFLRRVIGEGIPPLLVKHIFENLNDE